MATMFAESVCICRGRESNTLADKTGGPGLTSSENDLVAQARTGSLEAFDRLVSMHQARASRARIILRERLRPYIEEEDR